MDIADIDAVTFSSDGEDGDGTNHSPGDSGSEEGRSFSRLHSGGDRSDATESSRLATRERLVRFFRLHNPEKLATVDEILEAYRNADPALLWVHLEAKYGKESHGASEEAAVSSPSSDDEMRTPAARDTKPRGSVSTVVEEELDEALVSASSGGHIDEATPETRLLRAQVNLQFAIRDTSSFHDRAARLSGGKQRKASAMDRLRGAAKQAAAMASTTRMAEHRIALELVYRPAAAHGASVAVHDSEGYTDGERAVDEERSQFIVYRLPAMHSDENGKVSGAPPYQPSDMVFSRPLCDLVDVQARDLGRKDMVTFRYIPAGEEEEDEERHASVRTRAEGGDGNSLDLEASVSSLPHSQSAFTLSPESSPRLPRSGTTDGGRLTAASSPVKHPGTSSSSNALYRRLKRYAPPRSCFGSIGLCLLFSASSTSTSSAVVNDNNYVDARFQSSRRRDEFAERLKRVIASKMRLGIRHGIDDEADRQASLDLTQSIAATLASRPAVDKFVTYFQSQAQESVAVDKGGEVTVVDSSKPPFGGIALFVFSERVSKPRRVYVEDMKTRRPDGIREEAAGAAITVEPHLVIAPSTLRQRLRGVPTLAFPLRTVCVSAESDQWGNTFYLVRKDERPTTAAMEEGRSPTLAPSSMRVTVTTKSFVDRLKWLRWFELTLGRPAEFNGGASSSAAVAGDTATGGGGTGAVSETIDGLGGCEDHGGLTPWGGEALQRQIEIRERRRIVQSTSGLFTPSISGILGSTGTLRGAHDDVGEGATTDAEPIPTTNPDVVEKGNTDNDGVAVALGGHVDGGSDCGLETQCSPQNVLREAKHEAQDEKSCATANHFTQVGTDVESHPIGMVYPIPTGEVVAPFDSSISPSGAVACRSVKAADEERASEKGDQGGTRRRDGPAPAAPAVYPTSLRRRARTVQVVDSAASHRIHDAASSAKGSILPRERQAESDRLPTGAREVAAPLADLCPVVPEVLWEESQCVVGARERGGECWILLPIPAAGDDADLASPKRCSWLHSPCVAAPVRVQLCRLCIVSDPNSCGCVFLLSSRSENSAAAMAFRRFGADVLTDVCLFADRIRRVRIVCEPVSRLVSAAVDALEWCQDLLSSGLNATPANVCWLELHMDRLSADEEAAVMCEDLLRSATGSDAAEEDASARVCRVLRRAFLSPQVVSESSETRGDERDSESTAAEVVVVLRMHVVGHSMVPSSYSLDGEPGSYFSYYHDYADPTAALRVASALAPLLGT